MTQPLAGDLSIEYQSTRWFSVFYIYASVLVFAVAFNNTIEDWSAARARHRLRQSLRTLGAAKFTESWRSRVLSRPGPPAEESGRCGEDRFVLEVLVELGLLSRERDVLPLAKASHSLDPSTPSS
jgi:hypothetical protein